MNVARWTLSPAVEQETRDEARRAARAGGTFRLALGATLLAVPLTFLSFWWGPLPFLVGLAALLGAQTLNGRARRRQEAHRWERDAALIDEFGGREGWLVEIVVHQGEAPTGFDRGMMWIEDGRLYFAGRRTSFGLTAAQTRGFSRDDPVPGHRLELVLRLYAWTPAGQAGLSFAPVVGAKWQDRSAVYDLREAVERWRAGMAPEEGQLPPLALGPDAPSPSRLLGRSILAGLYWAAFGAALFAVTFCGIYYALISCAMVGGLIGATWGGAWSPACRYRAYRDRLRIREEA